MSKKKVVIRPITLGNKMHLMNNEQVNETCTESENQMSASEAFAEPLTGTVKEFMPAFLMKTLASCEDEEIQQFMFYIHDTDKDIRAEIIATVTINNSDENEIITEFEFDDVHDKSTSFAIRTSRYDIERFPISIYKTYCEIIEQTMLLKYYSVTK